MYSLSLSLIGSTILLIIIIYYGSRWPLPISLSDHIMSVLREEGFLVAGRKMYTLSPDQVRVLYSVYKSNRIIDPLINELTKYVNSDDYDDDDDNVDNDGVNDGMVIIHGLRSNVAM